MLEYKEVARMLILFLGWTIICFSLLPLIKSDKWYIRVFDYPRSQKFWINFALLVCYLPFISLDRITDQLFIGAAVINQAYLFVLICPYTPLAAIQMKKMKQAPGEKFKVFVANVCQDNRDTARFLSMIESENPEVVLLVETDQWWAEATQLLAKNYPHKMLVPLENTYGMVLYSRFKIITKEIRYLTDPEIPSIKVDLLTPEGIRFRLYGLHPKPPVPTESSESTQRDAEILIVAKEVRNCALPVIVAGDLNDVAWSYTTRLFLKVSELLDPRIGRGFYSTFHANYPLMRWPLDHFFCSSHFYLIRLERMPHIGSDHFPMLMEVSMLPNEISANEANEKDASSEDLHAANEKVANGVNKQSMTKSLSNT
jgi:endonuclease/exonuclease/phosphatase (EEP) superfamily protein YafD